MEGARYWVSAKRKHGTDTHEIFFDSATAMDSHGDSWEEQAYADDVSGILGGCVWPPRSYSCSFCRREFRSAQALGGHMNVHRRDRARLNQFRSIPSADVASFGAAYSSQICTLLYDINPNPEFSNMSLISPRSDITRDSSQPARKMERRNEKASALCLFSPIVQQRSKYKMLSDKKDCDLDLIKNAVQETDKHNKRRIEAPLSNFFEKLSSINDRTCLPQSDLLKWAPGSVDDLDLELRLGDAPKVN
ncbi:uncharacterized protein LOC142504965 [Primulina tabacum]|uniref:uncharacterized protein LOC142504965 n=1 Tax=Primulina tabacum TaxID=48773 RepID=UPI003F5A4CB0